MLGAISFFFTACGSNYEPQIDSDVEEQTLVDATYENGYENMGDDETGYEVLPIIYTSPLEQRVKSYSQRH